MTDIVLEKRATERGPALAAGLVGAVGLSVVALLSVRPWEVETLTLLLRSTARLSMLLFSLAFTASALAVMFDGRWSAWLSSQRRYVGLAFGGVHLIHGALVLTLARFAHRGDLTALSPLPAVLGGVLVYGVILAMMVTSRDAAVEAMGVERWRRLHRFGIWTLFVVFLADYASKAIQEGARFWLPVVWLLLALTVRLASRRRRRKA